MTKHNIEYLVEHANKTGHPQGITLPECCYEAILKEANERTAKIIENAFVTTTTIREARFTHEFKTELAKIVRGEK